MFVMNLIWLKLVITHGRLILILKSIFRVPCRICKTSRSHWEVNNASILETKMRSHVEGVGTCSLVLSSGFFFIILEKKFYIPSFSRNLISISRLVLLWYFFQFRQIINLYYKFDVVGNGVLSHGLFSCNLQNDTTHNALHVQTGNKWCVMNEDFSILWYWRLGRIS